MESTKIHNKASKYINVLFYSTEPYIATFIFVTLFEIDAGALKALFQISTYLLLILLLGSQLKKYLYILIQDKALVIMIIWVLCSYFWSASPGDTLNESKTIIRSWLFAAYLTNKYSCQGLFRVMASFFGITILLTIFISLFAIYTHHIDYVFPFLESSDVRVFKGFFLHKQELGRVMNLSAMVFAFNIVGNKKVNYYNISGFLISLLFIYFSHSTTSIIGTLISLSFIPLIHLVRIGYKSRLIFYLTIIVIFGSLMMLIFSNLEYFVVELLNKPPDFNGRFEIWQMSIDAILKRPLLGYGYSGFWTSEYGNYIVENSWGKIANIDRFHAHNGFIDLCLQLGFIGLGIFIINLISTVKRTINLLFLTKNLDFLWMIAFITVIFIFHLSEKLTFISLNTTCSIFMSISFSSIITKQRLRRAS